MRTLNVLCWPPNQEAYEVDISVRTYICLTIWAMCLYDSVYHIVKSLYLELKGENTCVIIQQNDCTTITHNSSNVWRT